MGEDKLLESGFSLHCINFFVAFPRYNVVGGVIHIALRSTDDG